MLRATAAATAVTSKGAGGGQAAGGNNGVATAGGPGASSGDHFQFTGALDDVEHVVSAGCLTLVKCHTDLQFPGSRFGRKCREVPTQVCKLPLAEINCMGRSSEQQRSELACMHRNHWSAVPCISTVLCRLPSQALRQVLCSSRQWALARSTA
jgi:hypothetical protein